MKTCSHNIVWGIVDGCKHGKPRNNCSCTGQAYYGADGRKVAGILKKRHFLIPLATVWKTRKKLC